MSRLWFRIKEFSHHQGLFTKGDRLIVAVSGGPDSVCLLDVLHHLSKPYRLSLILAHVNYNLRDQESLADEQLVKSLAQKYQYPLFILRPKIVKKNNLEENLRNIRYNFFEELRKKEKASAIAVAHQADDQVETFFLHLLRGSGLRGMAGMLPKNGKIIRPLLGVSRLEIIDYLRERKLKYRLDRSNKDVKFLRNHIRHRLLPFLRKEYSSKIDQVIRQALTSVGQDMNFLEEATKKVENKKMIGLIKVDDWRKLPISLQKRLILRKIEETRGHLRGISSRHVEEVEKILRSQKSKKQIFEFNGLNLERKGDKLVMHKI